MWMSHTGLLFLSIMALSAQGATYRNLSSVHDSAGGVSTNTVTIGSLAYANVSAIGQPGGVLIHTNGSLVNYAGFLQSVDIKRPLLDSDGDGVIDELSEDNDGDGLPDATEIEGSAFDPSTATEVNLADSDADGASDYAESVAGTDPRQASMHLKIESIQVTNGNDVLIAWLARSNKTYKVRADDLLTDGSVFTNMIKTNALAIGPATPPWYAFTNAYLITNGVSVTSRFYRIEALP